MQTLYYIIGESPNAIRSAADLKELELKQASTAYKRYKLLSPPKDIPSNVTLIVTGVVSPKPNFQLEQMKYITNLSNRLGMQLQVLEVKRKLPGVQLNLFTLT